MSGEVGRREGGKGKGGMGVVGRGMKAANVILEKHDKLNKTRINIAA